jgi:hypothetical protein
VPQFDVNSPTNVSPDPPRRSRNIRRAMFDLYDAPQLVFSFAWFKPIAGKLNVICYAASAPSRKPRIPMDVDQLVTEWRDLIVGMALATDKKTIDEHEAQLDRLLEPFLRCPVKQIREFARKLTAAMQADKRLPLFIRVGVEAYLKVIVGNAKDTSIVKLKKDIAGRIAKVVEGDVQPQLVEAITNALMWRDPETLEKIEGAAKQGHKAKLVGRQSCLFLEIGGETVML